MLSEDKIWEILRAQNYWFRELETGFIPRPQYLDIHLISSKSILALKGPRRAGKTTLLKQIIGFLEKEGFSKEQILYVNLEDYRFFSHYSLELLDKILAVYRANINPDKKSFVLLDEIQNVEGFEKFLRTIYDTEKETKFIITGSNARLLSQELGTLLTGRIATIEVLPFSFAEYLEYHKLKPMQNKYYYLEEKKTVFLKHFSAFMQKGSIPEFLDEEKPFELLREYFENVIYRDIVQRFNIRNPRAIKELGILLATNSGNLFSINQLTKTFKISINTIQEYLYDLELSYLFFYLQKYSYSVKEKLTSQSKVYCVDTGLINAIGEKFSTDEGLLLESIVFLELKREGNETYYHKEKLECDFVVKSGLKIKQAIQVTKSLESEKTKQREIRGLLEAIKKYKLKTGTILTKSEFQDLTIEKHKIKIRPVWFWLLNKKE